MFRAVITGMGVVTPAGNEIDTFYNNLFNGNCCISLIENLDTSDFSVKLAAQVKEPEYEQYFAKRELKHNARFVRFARFAAKEAWKDSGLNHDDFDGDLCGVLLASSIGGFEEIEKSYTRLTARGPSMVSPLFIPSMLINMASSNVAIDLGLRGSNGAPVAACASGAVAVGEAYLRIVNGIDEIIVAGGSEASITPLSLAGFSAMTVLYEGKDISRASIPFDSARKGFVMGEGSGVLIVEELGHALKRGARIYAEICGYGVSCDACSITAPDKEGIMLAMKRALTCAEIDSKSVDYINAHGTSTQVNDRVEAQAIAELFGNNSPPVSSTKSIIGHTLGAAGAIESVASVLALYKQKLLPNANYCMYDDNCPVNIVTEQRAGNLEYVLSNSFGFGGQNACLVFKRWT